MTEGGKYTVQKLININKESEIILKQGIVNISETMVPGFKFSEELKETYNNLVLYFTGNGGYDRNKAIYLYGEYGVGKTVTMSIFSKFLATCFPFSANGFGVTSIEKLAEYYKQNGNMAKYGRNIEDQKPFNLCVNEFGKEMDEKFYGTNIQNVFNSLMMVRYEMFQEKKVLTHATSNFHPSKLTCFDDAIMDRLKEMFNFIEIKGTSFR